MHPRQHLTVYLLLLCGSVGLCACKQDASEPSTPAETPPELTATPEPAPDVTPEPTEEALMLSRLNAQQQAPIELLAHHELGDHVLDHFRLANGLEVITVEDHFAPVIAYQTWLKAGSRHEPEGKQGLAHILEHLMFRETQNLADGSFDHEMEQYGIDPSATTWLDYTNYYQKIPSERLAHVARIEAERMANLTIRQDIFEAEHKIVKNERSFRVDSNPQGSMLEIVYHQAIPDHPYRHPTSGYPESLNNITLEDCQWFFDHYYGPNNAAVVLVGDFETEAALSTLRLAYGDIEPIELIEEPPRPSPLPAKRQSQVVAMPIDAEMMLFGFPAPALGESSVEALHILNEAMFASPHGRLYRSLKLDKEWVANLQGWVPEFRDRGVYEVFVTMRPEVSHEETRGVILSSLAGLARQELTPEELERARNRVELEYVELLQDTGAVAEGLGQYWIALDRPELFLSRLERVKAVTREDIRILAAQWFKPQYLVEVLAQPKE